MVDRPLLLFSVPEKVKPYKRGGRGADGLEIPDPQQQWVRIKPKIREVDEAFNAKRMWLQEHSYTLTPELLLVIEIVGQVEDFYKAVDRIDGFELMGEIDVDEIPADQNFHYKKNPTKS